MDNQETVHQIAALKKTYSELGIQRETIKKIVTQLETSVGLVVAAPLTKKEQRAKELEKVADKYGFGKIVNKLKYG